ncbi:MAG: FAD-dependent oxidoreductase [Dehalococcoidia bacterium]|nr:FAD-dependent oxidoreductase [Dehalococcoidia bacterium]
MKLFEPGKIGNMVTKNRIVMAPMGTGLSDSDGGFSRRQIDYYVARAKGGTGLIMPGVCFVDTTLEGDSMGLLGLNRANSLGHLNRISELCDAVHHYGAKIAIQLSPGMGRIRFVSPGSPLEPISASAVPCFWDPSVTTRELTIEEIKMLVGAFGTAAWMVQAAGADAIEIHGYGGYLMDQFQTALWNKRTDRYGGDLDGRLRFSMEIIGATRRVVGDEFPIIYKFTPAHYIEGGRDIEEGLEIAKRLENAGIDALHVALGCYEVLYRSFPCMYEPLACEIHLSEAVKKVVGIPVIAHGKLGCPDVAEKVLQESKADFVALGRPLLADPEWAQKVKQGRPEDIIPCIGDLEGCMGRLNEMKYASCTVNPATGMEREYALTPAERRKSVLVIGGGPGGLEAARVAASRGHEVALWEKSATLGGKLRAASVPDFKQDLRLLTDYLSTQVNKLGVKVELMKEATPELVEQANPEVVIIATGATPMIPQIPGMEGDNVFSAVDLLLGRKEAGERVIVAGGGVVGCETAVYLARKGKKVTIIEMMGQLIPEKLNPVSRMGLLNLVEDSKVEVLTGTKLVEVTGEGAVVEADGSRRGLKADSVVLALGFETESTLRDSLEGKVPELFAIGDCAEPRKILHAMWEGFHASRII